MPTILFLTDQSPSPADPATDNSITLPAAFRTAGWDVTFGSQTLSWIGGEVRSGEYRLNRFDLVWPLGMGRRADFMDRMQLLAHSGARLINPPAVYLLLHGKLMWADLMVPTHAAADPEVLVPLLHATENWVLKPAAGSFGRDVTRLKAHDSDLLRRVMNRSPGTWFLLQQDDQHIRQGEHRTLIAGATRIGSYRREPGNAGVSNLGAGGVATAGEPSLSELAVIAEVERRLQSMGAGFAAIDTSGGFLVEVNVANPGGLGTLSRLRADDPGQRLVAAITAWIGSNST
jgi:glutathione synthase/RimK-type ligase-like ATP-grasp enzyme